MNILLVEDDPGIGRFVSRGLAAEGHVVDWLRRGAEAMPRLKTDAYTCVILDLGLPDVDGLALCRELRVEGIETPVLMLTARDGLDDRLDGFRSGADDYLSKPFAFEELLARLRAVARRGGGVTLKAGALALDLRARTATVGADALELPRREFDVLASLARHAGKVVSREQILDEAWGLERDVALNAVDVYVGYLRRRLGGYADAPTIETVRGAGFRLTKP
jgi:DNA-binding response OmpR family regulator